MNKIQIFKDWLFRTPVRFFIFSALMVILILYFVDMYLIPIDWGGVLTEAHGFVFDLIVFGILLSLYDSIRGKRERIRNLEEEIDDYRGWKEQEAMYRIVGALKRLRKEGVTNIDLSETYLAKANLSNFNLSGVNLSGVNLSGADLTKAILSEADLTKADLSWVKLSGADLSGADLSGADLTNTVLIKANLTQANLRGAEFGFMLSQDYLRESRRMGHYQIGHSLKGADLRGADLRGTKNIETAIFKGANIEGIILDEGVTLKTD